MGRISSTQRSRILTPQGVAGSPTPAGAGPFRLITYGGNVAGEQLFSGNQGPPSAGVTTDSHVFPCAKLQSLDEVSREWHVKARLSASAGDASVLVAIHAFDSDVDQWHFTGSFEVVAVSTVDKGNILPLTAPAGATHIAIEVIGADDADDLAIMIREVN